MNSSHNTNMNWEDGEIKNTISNGNVVFEACGISELGYSKNTNNDNLYLNGTYMKSFQFSRFEKYTKGASENALFAVCGNVTENKIAEKLLGMINTQKASMDGLSADEGILRLRTLIETYDAELFGKKLGTLDLGIIFISRGRIGILALGNIKLVRFNKLESTVIFSGDPDFSVGSGMLANQPELVIAKTISAAGMQSFLLATGNFLDVVGCEKASKSLMESPLRESMIELADYSAAVSINGSKTAIGIQVMMKGVNHKKFFVAAAAFLLLLFIGIAAIGAGLMKETEPSAQLNNGISINEHNRLVEQDKLLYSYKLQIDDDVKVVDSQLSDISEWREKAQGKQFKAFTEEKNEFFVYADAYASAQQVFTEAVQKAEEEENKDNKQKLFESILSDGGSYSAAVDAYNNAKRSFNHLVETEAKSTPSPTPTPIRTPKPTPAPVRTPTPPPVRTPMPPSERSPVNTPESQGRGVQTMPNEPSAPHTAEPLPPHSESSGFNGNYYE